MKVQELFEAPLPDDWDKSTYKPNVSFAKRIRYAVERAQKMGTGSSRVAFVIEYEGRPTILKIAKNKKGLAQNNFESQMFEDYYVKSLNITIPMIDYDEEHDQPLWIHTEKAEKMKPNQFKKFFGLSHFDLQYFLEHMIGKKSYPSMDEKFQQLYEDNEYLQNLVELVGNYDLPIGDFTRLANWGVYKNRPVIIDLGLSSDVLKQYYS